MGHNTKLTVIESLTTHANDLVPTNLDAILKATEASIGIGINREWAVTQLEAGGFKVADQPDQLVEK